MSFGSSSKKTTSFSKTNPWSVTIPFLKDYLGTLQSTANANPVGPTQDQTAAVDTLKANAQAGNPFYGQISDLAASQFASPDRTGDLTRAYGTLQTNLADVASGKNQSLNDPTLQAALRQVRSDAANSVNAQFAGAGRDLSGANQMAVGRGVTAAEAPLLLSWLQGQQGRTDAANQALFNAGAGTSTGLAGLDAARNAIQSQGVGTADAVQTARDQGANTILNLDQQMKDMPFADLAQVANILFPMAQLGSQQVGASNTKSSGFGISIGDIGKGIAALGSAFCDARIKTDAVPLWVLPDGLTIYRFHYVGRSDWSVGPMAQDVAKLYPEAVVEVDGVLAVNFGTLATLMHKGEAHGAA